MKILIIEDNDILRENIKKFLEIKWFKVDSHSEYEWSIYKITTWSYDIVILDLWLWNDEKDWLDICKQVRSKGKSIPILMLTARSLVSQKIEWLNIWADDYMTKPFSYDELYARIYSITRRDNSLKWSVLSHNGIEIDLSQKLVKKDSEEVSLSNLEYNLLVYLMKNKWKILTKEIITEKVWGEINLLEENRRCDIYIWYLRKKLWPDLIETVRWTWYIIK